MGVNVLTAKWISKFLPCRILSLGFPDHLHGNVNLDGSSLTSIDIIRHHGTEVIVDLSYPQNTGSAFYDLGLFDLVIDCGTIEHCSNPAQAFINAASAVKENGHILHELPINMVNHGYWNINPVWFSDFYKHNHFDVVAMERHLNGGYDLVRLLDWPGGNPTDHMFVVCEPCVTMCIAKRTSFQPISLPKCQAQWVK